MARFKMLIFSNPTSDKEEEFNNWYTNEHVPDVLTVPGYIGAQRFRIEEAFNLTPADEGTAKPWSYLAIYEIEADSIAAAQKALGAALAAGQVSLSDSIDHHGVARVIALPITDLIAPKP